MKNRKSAELQQKNLDKELAEYLRHCVYRKETPRQRFFTNEFKIGDKVAAARTRHGWHDYSLIGIIIRIGLFSCVIQDNDGHEYSINRPRDIAKI